MKPGNFNWFLHTMLFYHTKHIITQQKCKERAKAKAKPQNRDNENKDLGLDQENNLSDQESNFSDQENSLSDLD